MLYRIIHGALVQNTEQTDLAVTPWTDKLLASISSEARSRVEEAAGKIALT
jgi:hypothetical protein